MTARHKQSAQDERSVAHTIDARFNPSTQEKALDGNGGMGPGSASRHHQNCQLPQQYKSTAEIFYRVWQDACTPHCNHCGTMHDKQAGGEI
eukprot:1142285-Pelagomonas_calceolata.AAC.2